MPTHRSPQRGSLGRNLSRPGLHSPRDAPKRALTWCARLVALKASLSRYRELIARYLDGGISLDEFEDAFFPLFKNEGDIDDDRVYEVLNSVFVDLDCVTNPPPFQVTEPRLRENLLVYLAQVDALIAEKH